MRQVNLISRSRGFSLAAVVGLQLLAGGSLAAVPAPGHGEDGGHAGTIHIGAPALTIPPGTDIPVTIDENIALKRDQVGRTFPAHVTRNVVVHGAVAIPAGAPAEVVLIESEETPSAASFRLVRISIAGAMRPVRTDVARADATRALHPRLAVLRGVAIGLLLGRTSDPLIGAG